MKIITFNRYIGRGDRELGKRFADTINLVYCDREIISAISQSQKTNEYKTAVAEFTAGLFGGKK